MMFNEFNRRLHECRVDDRTKYLLTHMFEVQVEMNKQLDAATKIIVELTDTVAKFVALHEATQGKVKQLMEFGRVEGVEVHSVRNDPDDRTQ